MTDVFQNSTGGFFALMVDPADNVTGVTGLSLTVERSKNGEAFAAVAPTITDRGNGWYWIEPLAADRDTLGQVGWQVSSPGAVTFPRIENVIVPPAVAGDLTSIETNAAIAATNTQV